ncbi:peptide/nickel transport system permease protein [Kribbella orskensis]|uniref:Peptide/nickel transport system permease protein n=1 Tax=Kribbella orskensis TaxID=2512216 RepID=A0ABY2BLJ6_9ACTN|nr:MULTISPECIES: ABC transporter permease [Kribbella]TCN40755.1 peptide/nickel transport system permease protein [Kribbella sp. VKM Ac-2500]TCO24007.1 peptide/nickel transport system permease protein [Kribbella orskensis]
MSAVTDTARDLGRRGRRAGASSWSAIVGVWRTPGAKPALIAIGLFVMIAVLAPWIAPYGPFDRLQTSDGSLARSLPPSLEHPFGTTSYGRDVFSQVIWGTQRTLSVGLVGALATVAVGVNVGLIAGFAGGRTDSLLMRITDSAYAVPFLPFAIVLVGLLGRSDAVLLLAIAALFWRTSARVVRSQVLTLKERTFVRAAVVAGANRRRVLYKHIAPNVASLAMLYGIFLVAEAVLAEASLSFLGLAPPNSISWGTIMFDAFTSPDLRTAWWWAFFPGLTITVFVLCTSLLGRAYESAQAQRTEGRRS